MTTNLAREVARFKEWAPPYKGTYGEWECDYENWDDLWASALDAIAAYQNGVIPDAVADDLLYAVARDNECEYIRKKLLASPKLITPLVKRSIVAGEADAKWQIAVSVGEAQLPDAADLLRLFLTDTDEYVRRRSLLVFASFAPKEAEEIAIKNLDDDFEYTRIAALHVLYTVRSNYLDASLDRLASDPNEYVRQNVCELRVAQGDA